MAYCDAYWVFAAVSRSHTWRAQHRHQMRGRRRDARAGRLADRLRAAAPKGRVDAWLDFFGGGYVELAVTELGIAPQRIDTVIDFPALERFGVMFVGNQDAADAAVLAELAALIAAGELEVPIAEVIPLDEVQRAYRTLERRHTRGKIVLRP
jgi:NADPH:quinone reductase-like Zn-dependent oxidoreductase